MKHSGAIVDGKALADQWLDAIALQVQALAAPVGLAALCIGDDPGLKAFTRLKQKAAESVGITFSTYFFDTDDEQGAQQTIRYLAADDSVHGIFVELPLPAGWDRDQFLSLIPPEKDVDALTTKALVPAPAVRAVQYLFEEYSINSRGKRAAVVGAGFLVGAPLARWLSEQGAHVDVIDIDTPEPAGIASQADIVVAGVGKPGLVTDDWIKEGATVIDFGYGKKGAVFAGDVDFAAVKKKAGLLTPVPGGMGPLLIAAVLENLLTLATR